MDSEHGQNEADSSGAEFDALIDAAAAHAVEARAPVKRAPRANYMTAVRETLSTNPDIADAALIRKVAASLDIKSSGLDAMSDEELIAVVMAGRRVLDIRRELRRQEAPPAQN